MTLTPTRGVRVTSRFSRRPSASRERTAADAELPGDLGLRNPLAGLELARDDRLDDLVERFAGDRRGMIDAFQNSHEMSSRGD